MKRIPVAFVLLLMLVVAACASEEAASASPSEAEATVEPTPDPTPEPSGEGEPLGSGLALPSFDLDGDPELAGRFPETVGGQPLELISMRGDQMGAFGGTDPTFERFLDSLGAELSDVSFAFGGAGDPTVPSAILSVGAFRVLGASEDDLEREFIAASEDAGDMGGFESATVGGKDVLTGTDPSGETELSVYLYTNDDTLYFLTGTEEQVAEILEALP